MKSLPESLRLSAHQAAKPRTVLDSPGIFETIACGLLDRHSLEYLASALIQSAGRMPANRRQDVGAPFMKKLTILAFVFSISVAVTASAQQTLDSMIDRDIAQLVSTYKMLHAAPELSHHEEKTAAFFAAQLRGLGFTVTERIGKYERTDLIGYGVVAVMQNGA